jgi:hypothetical protein
MTDEESIEAFVLRLLEEYEAREAARQVRRDNPYVLDLILPHRRGLRRPLVLDLLHKSRRDRNLPIPSNFDETVQSVFQQHCADSAVFKKKGKLQSEALFYWPDGKGAGKWAIYADRAEVWLKDRTAEA